MAYCFQSGSAATLASGEPEDGVKPAMIRAVSSALAVGPSEVRGVGGVDVFTAAKTPLETSSTANSPATKAKQKYLGMSGPIELWLRCTLDRLNSYNPERVMAKPASQLRGTIHDKVVHNECGYGEKKDFLAKPRKGY